VGDLGQGRISVWSLAESVWRPCVVGSHLDERTEEDPPGVLKTYGRKDVMGKKGHTGNLLNQSFNLPRRYSSLQST
jgi:hypothetical protein